MIRESRQIAFPLVFRTGIAVITSTVLLHNGYIESSNCPTADEDCHILSGGIGIWASKFQKTLPKKRHSKKAKSEFQAKLAAHQVVEQKQLEQKRDAERRRLTAL